MTTLSSRRKNNEANYERQEKHESPSSQTPGAAQIGRLTNLMQLTVDTSWWMRYRSTRSPDLGASFPQLIPSLNKGQHAAIRRNEAELGDATNISDHVQAIANTAAF